MKRSETVGAVHTHIHTHTHGNLTNKKTRGKQMKRTKTQKGITLIALIITIVILLILAVVAIRAVQNTGIITHAKNAVSDYEVAQDEEEAMLQKYLNVLNEETKTETDAGGEKYKAVPVGTNCEKYYVDIDKETEGPEGIIYIDKAKTVSGSWERI